MLANTLRSHPFLFLVTMTVLGDHSLFLVIRMRTAWFHPTSLVVRDQILHVWPVCFLVGLWCLRRRSMAPWLRSSGTSHPVCSICTRSRSTPHCGCCPAHRGWSVSLFDGVRARISRGWATFGRLFGQNKRLSQEVCFESLCKCARSKWLGAWLRR
jgi:hypothetical protein